MEITFYSFLAAVVMLALGVMEAAIYQRFVYPVHRKRHEKAKLTGTQGRDPSILLAIIKLAAFIVMPVLAFMFGDMILRPLLG
ncbi:MAG TPA: hypothetical protein ENJ99_07285 [Rhizobiales bacterium]|nr:hypothetical protein [Hyphomicrobiales bacterium]